MLPSGQSPVIRLAWGIITMTENNRAVCPYCQGRGDIWYRVSKTDVDHDICWRCDGSGEIDVADLSAEEQDEILDLGIRPARPTGWTIFDTGLFIHDR